MVTTTIVVLVINEIGLHYGRPPPPRRGDAEVVVLGHPRTKARRSSHLNYRVFTVKLERDDQRLEDGRALPGVGVPDKQLVLFSDARGPDRIFDQIIVEATFAVDQMGAGRSRLAEQVVAGFSERRFRKHQLAAPEGRGASDSL